ncbi:Trichosetin biosynthesis cluster transcription factor TF23 like protein [Verticillium longisporum]|uniref:Trichosetin biosynthesis cluster transcription factor TF23 like protein n=1 Tax=Verticillium longisporum TaxID=100787 RepID=A0A8I2ZLQ6_VERLO|nr:Trichosetin biosynthesis cluster transcription factor TF23 like protein [Verticillium longisporum]
MLLYLNGEYSARFDADMALWLIGSLTTRVAFRLGYHRDPKWFPSLTPFQAEMRRRVWATVRMSDIFMSQHLALPAMIHDQDCDTELPSNVFDEDFGPETEIMPPPRPSTEPTPIAYALAKCRLGLELGNIIQVTGRVGRQVHYEEILRFDARLQEIMEGLPPHLKMTPLEGSQDPVSLLMARFSIDILYQKILRTAIEASLVTLQHLATLHRETQPNGRLRSVKWYISSTATKDFLLPAMMVVMDLHVDKRETGKRRESDGDFFWTPEQRMNMIGNLELTRDVWKGLADTSMEAFKASKVLEIMLEKIRSPEPSEPIPEGTDPFAEADTSQDMHPEHSAAVTLGMLSGGMTPNTAAVLASMQQADSQTTFGDVDFGMSGGTGMTPNFPQDIDMNVPQSPFSMFGNLEAGGDLMANFDWNAFESYTQSANWGAENGFGFLAPQQPDQAPSSQAQQPNNGNKGYIYPNPNASGL